MRDSKTNQYKSSSLETIVMQMLLSKLLLTVDFGNFSLCSKIKLNTDIIKLLHEFDNKKKKIYIYIYIYRAQVTFNEKWHTLSSSRLTVLIIIL